MKIERISDNSIRCTLSSLDLSSRNLNLRELAYGSAGARRLFLEMLQKAQEEFGFTTEGSMVLQIEAVPLQGGALQMTLTRVDDPQELDMRFARFAPDAAQQNGWISKLASEILEGAQEMIRQIREKEGAGEGGGDGTEQASGETEQVRIFRFRTLDQVTTAAAAMRDVYNGVNTLYKDRASRSYYLVLRPGTEGEDEALRAVNLLTEYGVRVHGEALNEAYYEEHFEALIRDDALQKLSML